MIRFLPDACHVLCGGGGGGGGALFLAGRLGCPEALPVGDGDSDQNSSRMKLLRPDTFHA
ncbi:hypothetical protein EYF80_013490 [Liparis tanakae]|uniref:Uncharacterized protein n=1 Tax=Liparis tanakae TaxID=230148 RepID=A0A4Z2IFX8_9TELE|nr:hypothetical protein EYF80_013490 [Liparis tanakae]